MNMGLIGQVIQLGILVVLTITLVAIYKQHELQNKLFKAQVLKDRFEMYWNTYAPVSDDELRSFTDHPDDWITSELYESAYRNNPVKIRRYISTSKKYEYLAFTYRMKTLEIEDPLGDHWLEKWTEDLLSEEEFFDVHDSYKGYYQDYEKYVNDMRKSDNTS